MPQTKIYLVTEGYGDDTEIIAAFPTNKAAKDWIIAEATRRRNQDASFSRQYTLQYFVDWFHIKKIRFYEEPGTLTKKQLKNIFISKYYLQPASYDNLQDVANLLIEYLANPEDQRSQHK